MKTKQNSKETLYFGTLIWLVLKRSKHRGGGERRGGRTDTREMACGEGQRPDQEEGAEIKKIKKMLCDVWKKEGRLKKRKKSCRIQRSSHGEEPCNHKCQGEF